MVQVNIIDVELDLWQYRCWCGMDVVWLGWVRWDMELETWC